MGSEDLVVRFNENPSHKAKQRGGWQREGIGEERDEKWAIFVNLHSW